MSEQGKKQLEKVNISRRSFLKNTGLTLGTIAIGTGMVNFLGGKNVTEAHETVNYNHALMYLTLEQFAIVETAAERIFPATTGAPGAKALGVAYFIDHQMASPWGANAGMYTKGPFVAGAKTQGPQNRLTKKQIMELGIKALEDYSLVTYNKKFKDLSAQEQDTVLKVFEDKTGEKKVTIPGITSAEFFQLLYTLTIQGLYSDPVYGGNKDMGGWKLKRFPGHQETYRSIIDKDEFITMEPKSLNSH